MFVDPRAAFERQPFLMRDGVHPNADGQAGLAALLWSAMTANGIAQAP